MKRNYCIRYYNLLTAGMLNEHIVDVDHQAERMFQSIVKSLAEKEKVT